MWAMPHKSRTESEGYFILKSLNNRMKLSDRDKEYYFNLKKGYEGELLFDSLTEKLECDCLILNDLLLKVNNTVFQIDSLILVEEALYCFEVKNYEGDYYYEQERLYNKKSHSEIYNPLNQINRSEFLLRQLLQNLGFKIPIHSSVVFINPEFTLYQAPLNKPFILPTQVNRYLNSLNAFPSKLDRKHNILADKLTSLHIKDSPFKQLPAYNYDPLQKGITCAKCNSFSLTVEGRKCFCTACDNEELVDIAVMRSVDELKRLFPNQKITTNGIHEWCKVAGSKKRIKRILENNLKMEGVHQWAFFE